MGNIIAWQDKKDLVTIDFNETNEWTELDPVIKSENKEIAVQSIDWLNSQTARLTLQKDLPLGSQAKLIWGENEWPIYPRNIVKTRWFDQTFDASSEQLGPVYSKEKTSFSVWAPTANKMDLVLQKHRIKMSRKPNGVWHTLAEGDWNNSPYHFAVTVNGEEVLVNDPYAKSMTANSEQSAVIDLNSTNPVGFRDVNYSKVSKQDAIIYELHIRDATSSKHSGVKNKGKFLGLTEKNTRNAKGFSTGLSYISELGCTHVQLLPVQDFARVDELHPLESYNWGYDPLYYFVPEGSYSTNANHPYLRINECKEMIQAFHEENLSVILDVVYNHVFRYEHSAFEKLVPGYYFRHHQDGVPSNGSGTGNDIATERKMVRKFILECIDYWLTEYKVDGFRFDLMGLMDIETMQTIRERCLQEDRPILLLGEGWDLDTPLPPEQKATNAQSSQLLGISFFNDLFRDSMKGNLFEAENVGYANGNGYYLERIAQLVSGSCHHKFGKIFSNPLQSINFVECHDNHTLWDKLVISNPSASDLVKKRMHQLATGLTLISQGIPFLHAGQEFFRTKNGDENSYISGDEINQLDWEKRGEEDENVQWVRQLISLRKNYHLFRLSTAEEIFYRLHIINAKDPVFGYMLFGDQEDFVIFVNPTDKKVEIQMPSYGRWEKLISNISGSIAPINSLLQTSTDIGAYELAIWKKKRI